MVYPAPDLEVRLDAELHCARIADSRNGTKITYCDIRAQSAEVGVIEYVERLDPELKPEALSEP